jgi:hypothetical protein
MDSTKGSRLDYLRQQIKKEREAEEKANQA